MTTHSVTLEYQQYTMHAILRAVLPPEIKDVPTAFEAVGHIAHVNLREEQLPYKELIGNKKVIFKCLVCTYCQLILI